MCCCVNRSKRHCCLQGTLLSIVLLSVLLFMAIVVVHIGVYYLTNDENLSLNGRESRSLFSSASSSIEQLRRRRSNEEESSGESLNNQLARIFFVRKCPMNEWIVQSSQLLDLCTDIIPSGTDLQNMNDVQFKTCLRQSYWYIGMTSLLPLCFLLVTLLAVCRLWLCPMITLALVYLGLSLSLVLLAILYKSGSILNEGWPLFIAMMCLVSLYAILSLMLILLFAVVTCERRSKHGHGATNGDNENIMKMTDDDDEVDDPNIPLYKNGQLYSPQKRTDFDDKIKDFKYIDDDMSYVFRRG